MCSNISNIQLKDAKLLWKSTVGIERESLRVNYEAKLSAYPHSLDWGSRQHQPYIQTDFAESQLELITPPQLKAEELLAWLQASHQIVATTNEDHEDLLWPFSSPAFIPQDASDIKIAQLENKDEYNYRAHLADLYGKHVQLLSGIHYNFQINSDLIQSLFEGQDQVDDLVVFANKIYMHLGRNYLRYRWFLTYLFGATPYIADNYNTNLYGKPHKERMRSIRQSRYGYQNKEDVVMDYESLDNFVTSLEKHVNEGHLSLEKELYRDVRFRGSNSARQLLEHGIGYIELRNIDLNPYLPYGIDEDTINFIRLFLISLLYIEDSKTNQAVNLGNEMNYEISEADPLDDTPYFEEGLQIIEGMRQLSAEINVEGLSGLVDKAEAMLKDPSLTLAGKIVTDCPHKEAFLEFGLELAKKHQAVYLDNAFSLHGFQHLQLSTQDLLKEAIKAGIKVDIIDASDNILNLQYQDKQEYVRNANMTRLDSMISYFLMENKIATKVLLENGGLRVPQGNSYHTIEDALRDFDSLAFNAMVVKPKSTNYGLGISIFKQAPSLEDYKQAIELAFEEDKTVLVEEYIEGTELRFYVQAHKTAAIVERQAAHVIGDGQSSISELIDQINQDPLRGENHLTPLTKIAKTSIEALQLKNQGLSFESVPKADEKVYLRENSNVSTGGLSIDRTDQVHPSYKAIAEKAAQILDANFCGVDIIISDYQLPADSNNYGIIEANFNPSILIHRFPGQGKARLLGKAVLEQLFPEAFQE